jgi:uncharacterized protein YbjT (DUF2867 family)
MILVTGATGLSGSLVIREFARQQAPVRALVRSRAKARELETLPTVEVVEGDMLRPETLGPVLAGMRRVLMISSANAQMAQTQCKFVDACTRAGVRHIIKFSGAESGIGFDPRQFRFTRMHEDIERYVEQSGLAWTHLRPSQFMQVYLGEAPSIVAENAISLPFDDIKLSPIDVEDIAKIAFGVLCSEGHEGRRYEMTGPEALTMADIADRISQAIGKTIRYVKVTPEQRRATLLARGTPPQVADGLGEQTAERLKHPESKVYLGTHNLFGVHPTTFLEFARRNAAAFQAAAA